MVDETKLNAFVGKILGDLGGAYSVPMVRMGDKLGLYKALNDHGPMTAAELAANTKIAERYAREWLAHQAAFDQTVGAAFGAQASHARNTQCEDEHVCHRFGPNN